MCDHIDLGILSQPAGRGITSMRQHCVPLVIETEGYCDKLDPW